ncbi:MAG TPA: hypothetical protein VFU08_10950 [Candidatus Udaeobacter sp.]|nr:hypothetical protein [Candidatus Udaeobacter sp.]
MQSGGVIKGNIDTFMRLSLLRFLVCAALVIMIAGCDRSDQQIKVYRLVKAPLESAPREQKLPLTASTPQIKWELPEGWAEGVPSTMRYASFAATQENGEKVDISVVIFPGDGGNDLDNINRWRQQIGLAAVDARELNSVIAPFQSNQINFSTADMIGPDSRTLAAWVRREGRSWFFKLTGPKDAVEKQKPNFVRFLQSIRFEENAV